MKTADFTATIITDKTPTEAFNAIKNVSAWWSENLEGSTDKINDEFIYSYSDVHYCKAKLIELDADKRVVWLVLDNYFKFTTDKTEWKGTKLVFDISKEGDKTKVIFTHEGLTPAYECYDICRQGWTNYIDGSLKSLIETGKGQPNSKEDDSFNAELTRQWSNNSNNQ